MGTWTPQGPNLYYSNPSQNNVYDVVNQEIAEARQSHQEYLWDNTQKNKLWHYTSDLTERGLPLNISNGRLVYGDWELNTTGSIVAGAGSSAAIYYLSGGWGFAARTEAGIAAVSGAAGLTSLRAESRKGVFYTDQVNWYGTITYNIFTGEITNVNTTGLTKTESTWVDYGIYQERIIYTPTNTTIYQNSMRVSSDTYQDFYQPFPQIGMKYYGY